MKAMILFLLFATMAFADNVVLENQTTYPAKGTKMAVQWASSAREVDESNHALMQGKKLNSLQTIDSPGKVSLNAPEKAQYFRVLTWSKGEGEPDLHTNWVEIVPNKIYTLKQEHLVPSVLMYGTGC